jgi:hypothetical protein
MEHTFVDIGIYEGDESPLEATAFGSVEQWTVKFSSDAGHYITITARDPIRLAALLYQAMQALEAAEVKASAAPERIADMPHRQRDLHAVPTEAPNLVDTLTMCRRCGAHDDDLRGGICGSCGDDLRMDAAAAEAARLAP